MARGAGRIGVPELRVGVPFPLAALEIMRFAVRRDVLSEVILFGRTYSADESLARGIVDELVEPDRLLERALELAEDLASIHPASFARTKLDLRRPILDALAKHAAEHDRAMIEAWGSEPVLAAVRAFVEKTLGKRG
jgi:enoyl-CoA hydratase